MLVRSGWLAVDRQWWGVVVLGGGEKVMLLVLVVVVVERLGTRKERPHLG